MIIIICTFLNRNCIYSFRRCNNYLNIIIGPSYFKDIKINAEKIDIKYKFGNFVNKYNLTFSDYFNQEIKENVLPQSLLHLTFSYEFNQEIKENV